MHISSVTLGIEDMTCALEAAIERKFPGIEPKKLNELKLQETVIVLGTLIKVHKNQPSILKTIAAGDTDMNGGVRQEEHSGQRYDDEDAVFLEDDTQVLLITFVRSKQFI